MRRLSEPATEDDAEPVLYELRYQNIADELNM